VRFASPAETNALPVAEDDSYEVNEDGAIQVAAIDSVLANDFDPDMDPLEALLDSGPSNGSLTLNSDGSFDYTPNADFRGTDSFTYTANDGEGDSNPATVTIVVRSSQQQIDSTAGYVEDLVAAGILSEKDAEKLTDKTDKAADNLAKGKNDKVVKELERFIKEIDKLIDKGKLSTAEAQPLIDGANSIITSAAVIVPQQLTGLVVTEVEQLIDTGVLSGKEGNKLTKELTKAIAEFDRLHLDKGIKTLNKFVDKVGKLVDKDVFSAEEGQLLLDAVGEAIASALP